MSSSLVHSGSSAFSRNLSPIYFSAALCVISPSARVERSIAATQLKFTNHSATKHFYHVQKILLRVLTLSEMCHLPFLLSTHCKCGHQSYQPEPIYTGKTQTLVVADHNIE